MAFFFFKISFFCFRDIDVFLLSNLDQSFSLELKNGKILNKQNLWKLNQALFLKLVTTNVHQKRNKMMPLVLLP